MTHWPTVFVDNLFANLNFEAGRDSESVMSNGNILHCCYNTCGTGVLIQVHHTQASMDTSSDKCSMCMSYRIVISGMGFFLHSIERQLSRFNFGTGKLRVTVEPVRLDAFGAKDIFYIQKYIWPSLAGDCSALGTERQL